MAVPASSVPCHIVFAVSLLGVAVLTWFPGTPGTILVLAGFLAGFALRMVAAREPDARIGGIVPPLLAVGVVLSPSLIAWLSVPVSVRGPEGAGPFLHGLTWLSSFDVVALVVAFYLLPILAVGSLWTYQDQARRLVFAVGGGLWSLAFVLLAVWLGAPDAGRVGPDWALVAARMGLLVLAAGFVYALKASPDPRNDRTALRVRAL